MLFDPRHRRLRTAGTPASGRSARRRAASAAVASSARSRSALARGRSASCRVPARSDRASESASSDSLERLHQIFRLRRRPLGRGFRGVGSASSVALELERVARAEGQARAARPRDRPSVDFTDRVTGERVLAGAHVGTGTVRRAVAGVVVDVVVVVVIAIAIVDVVIIIIVVAVGGGSRLHRPPSPRAALPPSRFAARRLGFVLSCRLRFVLRCRLGFVLRCRLRFVIDLAVRIGLSHRLVERVVVLGLRAARVAVDHGHRWNRVRDRLVLRRRRTEPGLARAHAARLARRRRCALLGAGAQVLGHDDRFSAAYRVRHDRADPRNARRFGARQPGQVHAWHSGQVRRFRAGRARAVSPWSRRAGSSAVSRVAPPGSSAVSAWIPGGLVGGFARGSPGGLVGGLPCPGHLRHARNARQRYLAWRLEALAAVTCGSVVRRQPRGALPRIRTRRRHPRGAIPRVRTRWRHPRGAIPRVRTRWLHPRGAIPRSYLAAHWCYFARRVRAGERVDRFCVGRRCDARRAGILRRPDRGELAGNGIARPD